MFYGLIFLMGFIQFITCFSTAPKIPVILIHRSNSYYLPYSLHQAKEYNERVILIGDDSNNCFNFVEHYNMQDYFKEALDFEGLYKHLSTNPYQYELFCFQRWFVLKDFMEKQNIDLCFYCDSDVLLYCDVTKIYNVLDKKDMLLLAVQRTQNVSYSGGITYITYKAIKSFCLFLKESYENKNNIERWTSRFEKSKNMVFGGICDMTLFGEFCRTKQSEVSIGNLLEIIDGQTFDHHMQSDTGGYVLKQEVIANYPRKIKNVVWRDNIPYCYNNNKSEYIKFNCLHFQGIAKHIMQDYIRPK